MKIIYCRQQGVPIDVKVDDDMKDLLAIPDYKWYVDDAGYVVCWLPKSRSFIRMHQFIMNYYGPLDIDHINRIKHDNQRNNLRIVPHHINLLNAKIRTDNTNGYKGVFLNRSGNWGYQGWIKGKKFTKQGFATAEEASKAREAALIFRLQEAGAVH